MTTTKRLDALEGSSAGAVADHADNLAALLGAIDAIFWPMRTTDKLAQVGQLRRQYQATGLAWSGSSGGGSSRAWKSDQRLRQSMASAGLVKLTKTKSNLPLVKLTLDAEQQTRALIGLPTLGRPSQYAIVYLLGLNEDTVDHRPGGWCCESWLFNSTYEARPTSTDWDELTTLVLPLLVAGVVVSCPSTVKRVFFRLTEKQMPEVEESKQAVVGSLQEIYLDAFYDGLESRELLPKTHEISVPLSATR